MSDIKKEVIEILEALINDTDSLRRGLVQEFDLLVAGQWPPTWARASQGGRHTIIITRMLNQAKKRDELQSQL